MVFYWPIRTDCNPILCVNKPTVIQNAVLDYCRSIYLKNWILFVPPTLGDAHALFGQLARQPGLVMRGALDDVHAPRASVVIISCRPARANQREQFTHLINAQSVWLRPQGITKQSSSLFIVRAPWRRQCNPMARNVDDAAHGFRRPSSELPQVRLPARTLLVLLVHHRRMVAPAASMLR